MKNIKKILFVHNGTGLGGAPKALKYIVDACVKYGYSCWVACLKCSDIVSYFKDVGAKIIILDSLPRYTNSTTKSYDVNSSKFKMEREYAKSYSSYWTKILYDNGGFDMVFINSMFLCDLIIPSKLAGCKVIQVIRETGKAGGSLNVMKTIISLADSVLFISEYDKELFSLKSKNVALIHDAVNPQLYLSDHIEKAVLKKKYGVNEEDFILIYTGGDSYIKGPELLLKALLLYSYERPITLLYAGYSGCNTNRSLKLYVKKLLSYFSKSPRYTQERIVRCFLKLKKLRFITLKIIGYNNEIHELFKISDICIVPYKVPHQAMPIIEAGMSKIPCLVSDHPCYKDEIRNGINGYLLSINNPEVWTKSIINLINDKQMRIELGSNNYKNAIQNHDINKNKILMLDHISDILNTN